MVEFSRFAHFDRASLMKFADWAAIAVAVTLPWSTSAVGVAIAVWLVTLLPSLGADVKRALATPAGALPVILWCLGGRRLWRAGARHDFPRFGVSDLWLWRHRLCRLGS